MARSPLVSAIIVFLDEEKFLQEAIDSVIAQTHSNWELLLVDDGSGDQSSEIARQLARQRPERVRYLEHEGHRNRGASASRNLGVRSARGEYLAFLDADDVWLPHKLERQVAILQSQSRAGAVYSPSLYWRSWTGEASDQRRDYSPSLGVPSNRLVEPPALLVSTYPLGKRGSPCPSSILIRRRVVEAFEGFEESFHGPNQLYEDQVFLVKLYLHAPVFISDECLDRYRIHSESCSARVHRSRQYHSVRRFFLRWLEDYLTAQRVQSIEVWRALHRARWPYRHPILHRCSRRGRRIIRNAWKASRLAATMTVQGKRRSWSGQSVGSITAHPNPILVSEDSVDVYSDSVPVGATILSWKTEGAEAVEVRINAPNGRLLNRTGPSGEMTTDDWVADGTVFYLQDISDNRPLTQDNTLAATLVRVKCSKMPEG